MADDDADAMDVDCRACGWAGVVDDLRIRPSDGSTDVAVCPDCLSTDVVIDDGDDAGGEAGADRGEP